MNKESFYEILCHYTPEELNEYISNKGKKKEVNAVTFIKPKQEDNESNNSSTIIKGE